MTLEKQFEQEMVDIYMTAKKECGYNASRFLQMIFGESWIGCRKAADQQAGRNGWFHDSLGAWSVGFVGGSACIKARV